MFPLLNTNSTNNTSPIDCPGTFKRRHFLKAGAATLGGLTLPQLLRLQETLAANSIDVSKNKSMIVLWLWGGPSHMETFDLKPEAPIEYRGEFFPIDTNVPGIQISEHLPKLARLADKYSLIRSLSHDSPGHVNSTHTLMTAYPGNLVEAPPFRPDHPDLWSVISHFKGPVHEGVPTHVALPFMRYNGSAYLGGGLDPFIMKSDPNATEFKVPNVKFERITPGRAKERLALKAQFDQLRRDIDTGESMANMDRYEQKAMSMLTSGRAEKAFKIEEESDEIRDRYGRHTLGQRCLLARRLVEAGVRLVTVDFATVPGQKAFSWDDHASVWNIFEEMKYRLPVLDQICSAMITDLVERGLHDDVLFVVMGEMSHTPRLSNFQGQPGREHWGKTMSLLLSGGGLNMGRLSVRRTARG
ncbi:MAG: DUF1501 domain-containing protein [Planctomycetaceae bacterium]